MRKLLEKLEKGGVPSLLDTDKGNELINAINSLLRLKVIPAGMGRVVVGEKESVLDLSPFEEKVVELVQDTIEEGRVDDALLDRFEDGDLLKLTKDPTTGKLKIDDSELTSRLNNPVIDVVCNGDGSITASITI